jgi:hypothetical protein
MVFKITHKKTSGKGQPTDPSLVGGDDWDDTHDFEGLSINDIEDFPEIPEIPENIPTINPTGTFKVKQFVRTVPIPAIGGGWATYEITGLNGNADNEYVLEFDLLNNYGGGDNNIYLLPNGVETPNGFSGYVGTAGGNHIDHYGRITLLNGGWARGHIWGEIDIKAKSGKYRRFTFNYEQEISVGTEQIVYGSGIWKNDSDNLTSLKFMTNGTLEGTVDIYRIVDLVLG